MWFGYSGTQKSWPFGNEKANGGWETLNEFMVAMSFRFPNNTPGDDRPSLGFFVWSLLLNYTLQEV